MAATTAARRLAWRYYGSMLSAAPVAAALGAASAYATGGVNLLPDLLGWVAALLVVVNLGGTVWIYRPVRRYLRDGAAVHLALERRVRALPALSGIWIFGLTAAAMVGDAAGSQGAFGALAQQSLGMVAGTLVHCLAASSHWLVLQPSSAWSESRRRTT